MKETAVPLPETRVASGLISATIDGTPWQTRAISERDSGEAIASIDPKTGFITIRGTCGTPSGAMEVMEITLKSTKPGTYSLLPDFNNVQTSTYSIGSDTSQVYFIHEKQSGEATISQSDDVAHQLSGTFFFDARNTIGKDVHVTNGAFHVSIKE